MQILVYLFILELFFGFNGKLLVLGGISIRHWLFAITLVLVCTKAISFFGKKRKEEKAVGLSFREYSKAELSGFSKFDWALLGILLLHGVWIVLIPLTQLETDPNALKTALSAGLSITIMALYFPAVYLIRNGQVKWEKYRKMVIGCCIAIAVLHVILYVAERIQWEYNHTRYFMNRVFDLWENIVGENYERPSVIMPGYTVRIIYGFNIFLPMSLYFVVGQKKKRYLLWVLLIVTALLTTGTRALILGTVVGVCAFCVLDCMLHRWERETIKRVLLKGLVILLFVLVIDSTAFRGMNVTRLLSTFSVSDKIVEQGYAENLEWENSEYSAENEVRGTVNSNSTRILQIKELLGEIAEHPVFGHGFNFGVYDMQGLAYLAKVGIVGLLAWSVLICVYLRRVYSMEKRKRGSALPMVGVIVAIFVDVMLQAMFGSLTMGMAVFLLLDLEYKQKNGMPNQA